MITEIFAKGSNSNFEWFEMQTTLLQILILTALTISDASGLAAV